MARFRRKPVLIEAVKVRHAEMLASGPECSPFDEMPEWLRQAIATKVVALSDRGARDYAVIAVHDVEEREARPGDYVVRLPSGVLTVMSADEFTHTYVADPEPA